MNEDVSFSTILVPNSNSSIVIRIGIRNIELKNIAETS